MHFNIATDTNKLFFIVSNYILKRTQNTANFEAKMNCMRPTY